MKLIAALSLAAGLALSAVPSLKTGRPKQAEVAPVAKNVAKAPAKAKAKPTSGGRNSRQPGVNEVDRNP